MSKGKLLKIGTLAKSLNISTRTIRYYEEIGLINCLRGENSNYRMYDLENVNKLKQIVFLRKLKFSIEDIKIILLSENSRLKKEILLNKYREVTDETMQLLNLKDIIKCAIDIGREKGIENINFYNVLYDQVYINMKNEEGISMGEREILVEFGKDIIPYVDKNQGGTVIDKIKKLRSDLNSEYNIDMPLIHLRDSEDLEAFKYEISIDNKKIFSGDIKIIESDKREEEFLRDIRNTIIKNKDLINEINNIEKN